MKMLIRIRQSVPWCIALPASQEACCYHGELGKTPKPNSLTAGTPATLVNQESALSFLCSIFQSTPILVIVDWHSTPQGTFLSSTYVVNFRDNKFQRSATTGDYQVVWKVNMLSESKEQCKSQRAVLRNLEQVSNIALNLQQLVLPDI